MSLLQAEKAEKSEKAPSVTHKRLTAPHLPDLLKQAGVRVTHPRLLVLGLLWETPGRVLTANDLYQQMQVRRQPVSLSTIYSVLQSLRQRQLVTVRALSEKVQGFACLHD